MSDRQQRRRERVRPNLLDKAKAALDKLMAEKDAECAQGRFGVMIVRDQAGHTGIRIITDEATFVA